MTPQPPAPDRTDARDRLLDRVIADVAAHGLGDRSLRDIATAVGTSHRMLLYHFGSRPGLVAAIVDEVERRQRAAMAAAPSAATAVETWRRVSDPAVRPFVQLFFELAGQAARLPGRAGVDMTQPWVDDAVAAAASAGIEVDAVDVRLGVAVVRGLLVDLVSGGEPAAAEAAFERFVALMAGSAR